MGRKGNSEFSGYTTFSDKAVDKWSYDTGDFDGADSAQLEFFAKHSNYQELIDGMGKGEKLAINTYSGAGIFMGGQQYKGWDKMSKKSKFYTQVLDGILDRTTLDSGGGVIVSRLSDGQLLFGSGADVSSLSLSDFKGMKGSIIGCKANLASSAAATGLQIDNKAFKNVEYKIRIPGGSKGAGMYIDGNLTKAGQREFLINRDSVFKVGNTKWDSNRGLFIVDLEWTGHEKHDYGKKNKKLDLDYVWYGGLAHPQKEHFYGDE